MRTPSVGPNQMNGRFVGLMSGTSVDAVDAVMAEIGDHPPRILGKIALPIPGALRRRIIELCATGSGEIDRMGALDNQLGELYARAIKQILESTSMGAADVDAIGSHGQTVRHRPDTASPFTLQIGNPSLIAERTGIAVVADFRRRDMAAGGQGAPLAPAFHSAFFRDETEGRAVANIGGIANITHLPASGPVTGYDTGPGNTLMDLWHEQHRDAPFDKDGAWASGGRVSADLLETLLTAPFFTAPAPKSTGREGFNLIWLESALAKMETAPDPRDVQATLLALTVETVAAAVEGLSPAVRRLLVCGGGARNGALMRGLEQRLPGQSVETTADFGVDPDFVEATGFAWLAYRTLSGLPGNLPEVTGAEGPRILGAIYPA